MQLCDCTLLTVHYQIETIFVVLTRKSPHYRFILRIYLFGLRSVLVSLFSNKIESSERTCFFFLIQISSHQSTGCKQKKKLKSN